MQTEMKKKDGTPDRRYFPNHVRKKKRKQIILHGLCQCESCKRYRKKNGGNLVYMDPPYHKTGNLYSGKQWKDVDFVRLRNSFHELSISGLSRKKVKELVITNIPDDRLRKVMGIKIE